MGNLSSCDDESPIEQRCVGVIRRERSSPTVAARHHRVLDELVLSERRYVADMQMLIDVFCLPLKRWAEEQNSGTGRQAINISRSDIDKVFSNVEDLIVFSRRVHHILTPHYRLKLSTDFLLRYRMEGNHGGRLLPALERARAARSKAMLVVLLQLATSSKVYDVFVANCVGALEHLARMESIPQAAMFIKACELQERCRGLSLRDFLLMPLERVAQYRLLVESTAENCPPHLAELHNELARSLSIPPQVADQILRHRRDVTCANVDTSEVLFELAGIESLLATQPPAEYMQAADGPSLQVPNAAASTHPRMIKEGCLTKICHNGPKTFFFSICGEQLKYRHAEAPGEEHRRGQRGNERDGSIPLSHCFLIEGFDEPLEASFILASSNDSFLVQAKDVVEKDNWVATLQKVMREAASDSSCSSSSASTSSGSRGSDGDVEINARSAMSLESALDDPQEETGRAGKAELPVRQVSELNDSAGSSKGGTYDQDKGLPPRPARGGRRGKKGQGTRTTKRKKRTVFSKTYRAAMGLPVTEDTERVDDDGRTKGFPLEECSVWLARGAKQQVERVTLRLTGLASDDDTWRGEIGFRRALDDAECYASFRELLRERHASENLDFKEAVERFRSMFSPHFAESCDDVDSAGPFLSPGGDKEDVSPVSVRAIAARKIVRRFVLQEAPEQVNLSSKARETILRRQAGRPPVCPPPADLFDESLAEVSTVLQRDPFVHFRNCEAFLRLKQRWAQKRNGVLSASEVVLESDGMIWASEGLAKLAIPDTVIWPPRPGETLWTSSSSATSTNGSRKSAFSLFVAPPGVRRAAMISARRFKTSQRTPPPPPPATPATPWTGARFSARGTVVAAASPATMAITAARSVVGTASSCLQADHPEAQCSESSPCSLRLDVSETALHQAGAQSVENPHEGRYRSGKCSPGKPSPDFSEAAALDTGDPSVSMVTGRGHGAFQWPIGTREDRKQRISATSAASPKTAGLRAMKLSPVVVKPAAGRNAAAKDMARAAKAKREAAQSTDFDAFFPGPQLPSTEENTSSSSSSLSENKPLIRESPATPPMALPRLLIPKRPLEDRDLDDVLSVSPPSNSRGVSADVEGAYHVKYDVRLFSNPGKSVSDMSHPENKAMAPRSGGGDEMIDQEIHAESRDRAVTEGSTGTAAGAVSDATTHVLASPENYRILLRASPGECLGVHIANDDGMATVYAFNKMRNGTSNPAERAGLRLGDVLVSVNGLHVLGNFHQAVELMKRGQRGGNLSLVVMRPEPPAHYKQL